MSIVDQGSQPLSVYLLRILGALVLKANGELRIHALDLLDAADSEGQGLVRHYDQEKKELVLTFAPRGTELLTVKDGDVWQGGQDQQRKASSAAARSQPGLKGEGSLLQGPHLSPQLQPQQMPPSTLLTDERLAQMEEDRGKEKLRREAERVLMNFPAAPEGQTRRRFIEEQPQDLQEAPQLKTRSPYYKP